MTVVEKIRSTPEATQHITPDLLLWDNSSKLAQSNLRHYDWAKNMHLLEAAFVCSDARSNPIPYLGDAAIQTYPAIAAAYPKKGFENALQYDGVDSLLILGHHADVLDDGCGGLHAKHHMNTSGHHFNEKSIEATSYVGAHVQYPDVYRQTIESGLEAARYTNKQILVGSIDHINFGRIAPFAVIEEGGWKVQFGVHHADWSRIDIRNNDIDPADLILPVDSLPQKYQLLMGDNQRQVEYLRLNFPNFTETQRVQDPPAILVSTSPISGALRYPHTMSMPGSHFGIRIPFIKRSSDLKDIMIRQEDRLLVFKQLHYPLSHSNKAQPGQPFFGTNTVIFETKDIFLSTQLARQALSFRWMREWLTLRPENQILVGQVQQGITQILEPFQTKLK